MILFLIPSLQLFFEKNNKGFNQILALKGDTYRQLEGRCTQKITLNEKDYFIKIHRGVGWKEIFKNLLFGRFPILSAKNEWQAINRLKELIPVPTIVGYGVKGCNPAKLKSFLMTESLSGTISLEDFFKETQAPLFSIKMKLIYEVARIARTMHELGVNHRDFYACHFLLESNLLKQDIVKLYLIDLHRAQLRAYTPARWRVKDLAGLFFSVKPFVTKRDVFRFMKMYCSSPLTPLLERRGEVSFSPSFRNGVRLRDILKYEEDFWMAVKQQGEKLLKKHENHN